MFIEFFQCRILFIWNAFPPKTGRMTRRPGRPGGEFRNA